MANNAYFNYTTTFLNKKKEVIFELTCLFGASQITLQQVRKWFENLPWIAHHSSGTQDGIKKITTKRTPISPKKIHLMNQEKTKQNF